MRGGKLVELIRLAVALAASAEGMTLDEMAAFSEVGRRTAERRRDAIEAACGPLDRVEDGRQVRFRMSGRAVGGFAFAPTSQELAELENAARTCEAAGDALRAETLRSLHRKIGAILRQPARLRLGADIEAQLRAEALARQVGPRPYADPNVLATLREALLAGSVVKFHYRSEPDGPARWRKVVPYGLLLGPRYYLVARGGRQPKPVLFRLDRIEAPEATEEPGAPPPDFDLAAYAARSFGVFQEEPEGVALRFDASAAADARAYIFHPSQTFSDESDGALIVRFRAGGLLQIAHHLMTWGPAVTVLAPERLRGILREQVETLHNHCRDANAARRGDGLETAAVG
jgi:predicted DNA-binding transcriptional regulator YafY